MKNKSLFTTGVVLLIYVIFGGVVFHFLEKDHEDATFHDANNFTAELLGKKEKK